VTASEDTPVAPRNEASIKAALAAMTPSQAAAEQALLEAEAAKRAELAKAAAGEDAAAVMDEQVANRIVQSVQEEIAGGKA
jgi:hypothetical protein